MRLFLLISLFFSFIFSAICQPSGRLVTTEEYSMFLNAVAGKDLQGLYHKKMPGITRTGQPGNYYYTAVKESKNVPITDVTWWDAVRYCNWKEHGSPERAVVTPETTETGSYNLKTRLNEAIVQNSNAHYILPADRENVPYFVLGKALLYCWGVQDKESHLEQGVPLFQGEATLLGMNKGVDPGYRRDDIGICIIKIEAEDQLDDGTLLDDVPSHQEDESWNFYEEAEAVIGALIVVGSGYAYYHYCTGNNREPAVSKEERALIERRTAESVRSNRESFASKEAEEARNPLDSIVDVVTRESTGVQMFAPDNRSYFKKCIDWLRGRDFPKSIYQEAHLINSNEEEEMPSHNSSQQLLEWLTRPFYPYASLQDFKKNNPEYLRKTLERYQTKVQEHEETIGGQATVIQEHEALQREQEDKSAQKNQSEKRDQSNRIEAYEKGRDRTKIIKEVLESASKREKEFVAPWLFSSNSLIAKKSPRAISYAPVEEKKADGVVLEDKVILQTPAKGVIHQEVARPLQEQYSPLRKIVAALQEYLVLKFSERPMNEGRRQEGLIYSHDGMVKSLFNIWKNYRHLVERRSSIASKKILLWGHFVTLKSSLSSVIPLSKYTDITKHIQSISQKINYYPNDLSTYLSSIEAAFIAGNKEYIDDTKSIASQEAHERKSIPSPSASAEKLRKEKSFIGKFFGFRGKPSADKKNPITSESNDLSSPGPKNPPHEGESKEGKSATKKEELLAVPTNEDEERVKRVENTFLEEVVPLLQELEKFHLNSYEALHLAETNIIQIYDLMEFYEAFQGKVIISTSSFIKELKWELKKAREIASAVTDIVNQVEEELGGRWKRVEEELGGRWKQKVPFEFEYLDGGWIRIKTEQALLKAVLGFQGYRKQMTGGGLQELAPLTEEVKKKLALIVDAQEKKEQILKAVDFSNQKNKGDFLEKMKPLINWSSETMSRLKPSAVNRTVGSLH